MFGLNKLKHGFTMLDTSTIRPYEVNLWLLHCLISVAILFSESNTNIFLSEWFFIIFPREPQHIHIHLCTCTSIVSEAKITSSAYLDSERGFINVCLYKYFIMFLYRLYTHDWVAVWCLDLIILTAVYDAQHQRLEAHTHTHTRARKSWKYDKTLTSLVFDVLYTTLQ